MCMGVCVCAYLFVYVCIYVFLLVSLFVCVCVCWITETQRLLPYLILQHWLFNLLFVLDGKIHHVSMTTLKLHIMNSTSEKMWPLWTKERVFRSLMNKVGAECKFASRTTWKLVQSVKLVRQYNHETQTCIRTLNELWESNWIQIASEMADQKKKVRSIAKRTFTRTTTSLSTLITSTPNLNGTVLPQAEKIWEKVWESWDKLQSENL